jgi:hemolysin III
LLVSGGISYMLGIIFYLMDKVPYMHSIWHLLVLGGSVCHGLSVILFMA